MDQSLMRTRVQAAPVGRLATVTAAGRPHLVPCCYALDGDVIYTAVDDVKPKSTAALRRLENIRSHPAAALLVDHYEDDWSALWWVRLDGPAAVHDTDDPATRRGLELLAAKYPPYHDHPPPGPMITIAVEAWRAWP